MFDVGGRFECHPKTVVEVGSDKVIRSKTKVEEFSHHRCIVDVDKLCKRIIVPCRFTVLKWHESRKMLTQDTLKTHTVLHSEIAEFFEISNLICTIGS